MAVTCNHHTHQTPAPIICYKPNTLNGLHIWKTDRRHMKSPYTSSNGWWQHHCAFGALDTDPLAHIQPNKATRCKSNAWKQTTTTLEESCRTIASWHQKPTSNKQRAYKTSMKLQGPDHLLARITFCPTCRRTSKHPGGNEITSTTPYMSEYWNWNPAEQNNANQNDVELPSHPDKETTDNNVHCRQHKLYTNHTKHLKPNAHVTDSHQLLSSLRHSN